MSPAGAAAEQAASGTAATMRHASLHSSPRGPVPGAGLANQSWQALFAAAGILLHLVLRFGVAVPPKVSLAPLILVMCFPGVPLVIGLARRVMAREFGSDLLAGISIVAASLEGEYLVAAIVVLMLTGGSALEGLASRRASEVLNALARRMPQEAHRTTPAGVEDIRIADVAVGDTLMVYPHEICPADGVVLDGQGRMNEAFLTGEPFEISKAPGTNVISGALNGETALTIRAVRKPIDSRYARIMQVMEETQQHRPRLRRLGDRLGAWYTPLAVGVASLAWVLSGEPHRFLAVMVIATPCPLLIAIPVAILGAISLSARTGIIVKNPAVLEQLVSCRTFIFDKTGTLTYGRPSLTGIQCAPGFETNDVLQAAASLERYSRHPLARAILEAAERAGLEPRGVSQVHEPPGQGLRGIVAGREMLLTGRSLAEREGVVLPSAGAGLECVAFLDGKFAALFRFHDAPRSDSRPFVEHLGKRHAVNHVLLVSGDRDSEVRYLANEVGIREIYAMKSPEEKVAIVNEETRKGHTLYVGDGINDAPAMQAATVGVALGQNSDIAAEAADAVILDSSLGRVDELIHIGGRMRRIALQSAIGGMILSLVGMGAAAAGYLPPIGGAIGQEIIDLVAVLNAVRVALPGRVLSDY